jgi:hypothetical protein
LTPLYIVLLEASNSMHLAPSTSKTLPDFPRIGKPVPKNLAKICEISLTSSITADDLHNISN